ncbi:DUF4331 domain-containing protein [Sphingomicrobium flavum]|uniref:DUF4331 domain-containing protein n=1 Tax=Sphingomicrobium flavum TaxID=1229164 RepID=UPI0021ADF0C6|nr:DUF4331 domain-containing protein [Sphingomicrobium flavum]
MNKQTKLLTCAPAILALAVMGCSKNDDVELPPDLGGDDDDTVMIDVTPCLNQAIPGTGVTVAEAVVPDTLTIDYRSPSGFPNGRALTDPVIDVTLAVIFLDLATHSPATFAGLPLNPAANDVSFRSVFPYLATAQGTPPMASADGTLFTFDSSPDSAYVRVDRMGMPAVSTALIPTDVKIEYNDASPGDDAEGIFVDDIRTVLTALTQALADDLEGAGLTPCATVS